MGAELPPVSTTVPWAGSDAEAIVFGPPSTSVSLANTTIAVAAVVLGHRRRVVDRGRRVVDTGDGDRDVADVGAALPRR